MGIIVSLKMICEIHHIANGQVEIGLDGKEAMTAVFSEYHSNPDDSCYDLIQDIRSKITLLPITLTGRHVEGHQDDPSKKGYKPFKKIDWWGQLNIKMDKMAKKFMKKKKGTSLPDIAFGEEHLVVKYQGRKLSGIKPKVLYNEIYGKKTLEFWAKRHSIPQDHVKNIDWDAQHKAFNRLPLGKQRWLMKHLSGQCGVGHALVRRKYQDHDHCPLCNSPDETTSHVILCKDRRAKTKLSLLLLSLEKHMIEKDTEPSLGKAILQRLQEWRQSSRFKPIQGSRILRRAVKEQDVIGWENFLNGRPSQIFAEVQHKHYQSKGKRYHGHTWLSLLFPRGRVKLA
jgi:hypothetical protein